MIATDIVQTPERIEIISVQILDEQRALVEELKALTRELGIEVGWHYLLDLSWIISHLDGDIQGQHFLDAGAGLGVLQCYLAGNDGEVLSVDRQRHAEYIPLSFRSRYHVRGLRPQDVLTGASLVRARVDRASGVVAKSAAFARALAGIIWEKLPHQRRGELIFYEQDLGSLKDVSDESIDAVVSVSALEHNSPDALASVVTELVRVLKPGGRLVATLGAAAQQDWFHQPSQGWNFTDATLRRAFLLGEAVPSNYRDYGECFEALKNCAELRDNLSALYFRSGENGMPWGKWDPQYQPVGVLKVKRT